MKIKYRIDLVAAIKKAIKKDSKLAQKTFNKYAGAGYDPKYDAYYNKKTGEWIESTCGDKNCSFCKSRPKMHHTPPPKTNHQVKSKRGARSSNQRKNVRGTVKARLQKKK